MTWVRTVAGRFRTHPRYSAALCYNTFSFPKLNEKQKSLLEDSVFRVLEVRDNHSDRTLAQLYDPDEMPGELLSAHRELDIAVERCYRKKGFVSDDERRSFLLSLYEETVSAIEKVA